MTALLTPLLAILRVVPVWAWVIAAALAWGGWQRHRAITATEARAQIEQTAAVAKATAAAQAAARASEQAIHRQTQEVTNAYAAKVSRARRDADALRTERDRLLDAVRDTPGACAPGAGASAASGADGAAGLRAVLGACAQSVSELAAAADADAARLSALQAYVRAIGAASAPQR